jgi:hypothetical protein
MSTWNYRVVHSIRTFRDSTIAPDGTAYLREHTG